MTRRHRVLGWANFALLAAAVLKFIPILVSLAQGFELTTAQIEAGLAADRAWAMDLISDTPYLLVWFLVASWLQRRTGHYWVLPWREVERQGDGETSTRR